MKISKEEIDGTRLEVELRLDKLEEKRNLILDCKNYFDKELSKLDLNSKKARVLLEQKRYIIQNLPEIEREISILTDSLKTLEKLEAKIKGNKKIDKQSRINR